MRDLEPIRAKGFLTGYNEFVWMVILLQAAGGLVSFKVSIVFPFYKTVQR